MVDTEKEIYESRKYWRKVKAFLAVFLVTGLIGLGGLGAVLYAFHLDPDVEVSIETIVHACPHVECLKSHPNVDVSYGSTEVAWSGVFFLAYLCAAGLCSGIVAGHE